MQASFLVAKFPQVLAITHIDKETKGHPPPPPPTLLGGGGGHQACYNFYGTGTR